MRIYSYHLSSRHYYLNEVFLSYLKCKKLVRAEIMWYFYCIEYKDCKSKIISQFFVNQKAVRGYIGV